MFNLYFNKQHICQLSSFSETLERINNDTDETIIYLTLILEEDNIPIEFDLGIFTQYVKKNSLNLIEIIKNEKVLYSSSHYNNVARVRHFIDDDTSNDIPIRKVAIDLERREGEN